MENKESPKATGISGITGKIIKVRHATEADMGFIMENLEKYHLDTENLQYNQFVVAMENGNPIGFGRLKKNRGNIRDWLRCRHRGEEKSGNWLSDRKAPDRFFTAKNDICDNRLSRLL